MTLAEERMRILKMIEAGTITAEEGAGLVDALEESAQLGRELDPAGRTKWLRVLVTDLDSGKSKVNVNLPFGLVGVGVKMGAQLLPACAEIRIEDVLKLAQEGQYGKLADVQDLENNERVEIFVE